MGVPFASISEAAAIIRREAEYIASQSPDDIFPDAQEDLLAAVQILFPILAERCDA